MFRRAIFVLAITMAAGSASAGVWDDCAGTNSDKAVVACTKIVDANRQSKKSLAMAYRNRGLVYAKKGDFAKALPDFNAAIERNGRFADAYYDRGLTYYNLDNSKAAIEDFTKAILYKTKYSDAYGNRGLAYMVLGDLDSAIADLDRAIAMKPKNGINYFNRADAYERRQDWGRAVKDWKIAVKLIPASSKWHSIARERLLAASTKDVAKEKIAD
jgi:tetratricopeptide (TPR) repeat protein